MRDVPEGTSEGVELERAATRADSLDSPNHDIDAKQQSGEKRREIEELHSNRVWRSGSTRQAADRRLAGSDRA
jgi:hypothetical protein